MTAIKAAEGEAYDYLPKPFEFAGLMKRAARACGGQTAAHRCVWMPAKACKMTCLCWRRTAQMQALYRLVAR